MLDMEEQEKTDLVEGADMVETVEEDGVLDGVEEEEGTEVMDIIQMQKQPD